jgi:hypothetical protein
MSTISNFLLANLAERLTPLLQTPVEDIVYEILDRKGLPTRSEIRDLKNRLERIDEEVKGLTDQLARVRELAATRPAPAAKATPAAKAQPAKKAPAKKAPAKKAPAMKAAPKPVAKATAAASEPAAPKRRGRPPRQGPPPACTVAACKQPTRSKGLCAKHYQSWRRERLAGFVSPDGFVLVDGKRVKLDKRYAGEAVTTKVAGAEVVIGVKGKELTRKLPADKLTKKVAKKVVKKPAKKVTKKATKKTAKGRKA